jgi:glutamate dehydrogenase
MVNRGGITFAFRTTEEVGADPAQIARAYTVAREVFGLESVWAAIEAQDGKIQVSAQNAAYGEVRRLLDRATRWLLDVRFPITDVAAEIARYGPTVAKLTPAIGSMVRGAESANLDAGFDRLCAAGVPREIAVQAGTLLTAFLLLDVVEIAEATGADPESVARLHFALSERFSVDSMLVQISNLPRDDRWTSLARAALRHDLYAALTAITTSVLRSTDAAGSVDARIAEWEAANSERINRARATVGDALDSDRMDLATLSVALRVLRTLPT